MNPLGPLRQLSQTALPPDLGARPERTEEHHRAGARRGFPARAFPARGARPAVACVAAPNPESRLLESAEYATMLRSRRQERPTRWRSRESMSTAPGWRT